MVVDAKYGESGNSNRFDSEIVCTKIEIFEYLHKEFSNVTLENIERKTKLKRSSGSKERKKKGFLLFFDELLAHFFVSVLNVFY